MTPGELSTLENLGEGGAEVALTLVGLAFPAALPFIAIAKEAIPALVAARPFIEKAVADGKSAFEAAETASPDLGAKIKTLALGIAPDGTTTYLEHLDNVTKAATPGFAVSGWTDGETKKWLDDATPASDSDSRAGGG